MITQTVTLKKKNVIPTIREEQGEICPHGDLQLVLPWLFLLRHPVVQFLAGALWPDQQREVRKAPGLGHIPYGFLRLAGEKNTEKIKRFFF